MSSRSDFNSSASSERSAPNGCPAIVPIEEIGRLDELRLRVRPVGVQDAVLHVAFGRHDDEQHAPVGEAQELEVAERRLARFGVITTPAKCVSCDRSDAAAFTSCCGRSAVSSPSSRWISTLLERLHDHQAVDEEPIALRRRDASGRRVRARDIAQLLEVRHHVADRRRRKLEAGLLRQHARADGLALGDVAFDEGLQQRLGALIEHAGYFTGTTRGRPFHRRPKSARAGRHVRRLWRWHRLCFNRGPWSRPPRRRRLSRFPPGGADRAPREPRHRRAAVASRVVSRGARPRRGDRRRHCALHAVPGYPTARAGSARRRRRRGDRHRRRRHDAVGRAPARAVRRAADRRQPGAPRLPHRHSASRAWRTRWARCSTAATSRSAARCSRPRSSAWTARAKPRSRSTTSSSIAARRRR